MTEPIEPSMPTGEMTEGQKKQEFTRIVLEYLQLKRDRAAIEKRMRELYNQAGSLAVVGSGEISEHLLIMPFTQEAKDRISGVVDTLPSNVEFTDIEDILAMLGYPRGVVGPNILSFYSGSKGERYDEYYLNLGDFIDYLLSLDQGTNKGYHATPKSHQ